MLCRAALPAARSDMDSKEPFASGARPKGLTGTGAAGLAWLSLNFRGTGVSVLNLGSSSRGPDQNALVSIWPNLDGTGHRLPHVPNVFQHIWKLPKTEAQCPRYLFQQRDATGLETTAVVEHGCLWGNPLGGGRVLPMTSFLGREGRHGPNVEDLEWQPCGSEQCMPQRGSRRGRRPVPPPCVTGRDGAAPRRSGVLDRLAPLLPLVDEVC